MKVMFLVNGRWFKTLCKTVLEADTFDVSISTEKHNICARISEKCYFTSIDNYCLGYDTIDTIKTDFCFKRNYKNIKEFTAKLEDCFSSFINNSITDRHFHGNIDECISKILDDIKKESKRETETTETETTSEEPETATATATAKAKSKLNSAYGITVESDTAYKFSDIEFKSIMCRLKLLAPCDFPSVYVLKDFCEYLSDNQLAKFCKVCIEKGVFSFHYGYDPYHKTEEENKIALNCKPDLVTCNNVLNVINNDNILDDIIYNISQFNCTAIFCVYEGDKSGHGKLTLNDCYQRNEPAINYIAYLSRHFNNIKRKGNMFICNNEVLKMKMDEKQALNILYGLTVDNNPDSVKAISITFATIIKHCGYDIARLVKAYHKGDNVYVHSPNGEVFKFYLPQRKLYHYNGNGRYNLINWTKANEIMTENNVSTDEIQELSRPPPR